MEGPTRRLLATGLQAPAVEQVELSLLDNTRGGAFVLPDTWSSTSLTYARRCRPSRTERPFSQSCKGPTGGEKHGALSSIATSREAHGSRLPLLSLVEPIILHPCPHPIQSFQSVFERQRPTFFPRLLSLLLHLFVYAGLRRQMSKPLP